MSLALAEGHFFATAVNVCALVEDAVMVPR